jgi:hypothetical protein
MALRRTLRLSSIVLAVVVALFSLRAIAAVSAGCLQWFRGTGAVPGDESCETKCATTDVDLGTFHCTTECAELCRSGEAGKKGPGPLPCSALQAYAQGALKGPDQCRALAATVEEAAQAVERSADPPGELIGLLKDTLIGKGLREGRSQGPCFAGGARGAAGFRPELRDPGDQIQHAAAGLYIGYHLGWFGCMLAVLQENEPQDIRLYRATCPLGRQLNRANYRELAEKLRQAIGEEACRGK